MPQLRIGFLARDWERVEPWVHRLIAKVNSDKQLDVSAFINAQENTKYPKPNWLFSVMNPIERRIFGRTVPSQEPELSKLLSSHPAIPSDDAKSISSLKLDVIVSVDSSIANLEISKLTKHGVWVLDLFDQAGGLKALKAVKGLEAVSSIGLYRFSNNDPLRQHISTASINPKFMLSLNLNFMKEKALVLVLRELRQLSWTREVKQELNDVSSANPSPGTVELVSYYFGGALKLVKKGIWKVRRKIGRRSDQFVLLTGQGNALDFNPKDTMELKPPGRDFWADPFLWKKDGKTYCFYEHFCGTTLKGHIQVGEFRGNEMEVLGDALKIDIHLSFPYLFEYEDQLYMMPETCAADRIEIWKCINFPLKWELHSTALEGQCAADTMILRRDGKWWLFSNIATDIYRDNCSELHIFQIDGPDLKSVIPHRGNPVSLDSRTARNAGRVHEIDGKLYRPSQDSAFGQYGFGLNIMEIEELTLNTFRERLSRRIDPKFNPQVIACHHFDTCENRFIIDALKTN